MLAWGSDGEEFRSQPQGDRTTKPEAGGYTYEVDLCRMGELLLGIGTFRRICKKKDGQRGATTTTVEFTRETGGSYLELLDKVDDIPGDKVLCNTWRASMLSA